MQPDSGPALARLQTEARNPRTSEIDTLSSVELARSLQTENYSAAESIEPLIPDIGRALEEIGRRLQDGGRLFYFGAGTSGRLGVLDASECPPTFGVPTDLVQGVIAGGDHALRNSIEGAEDDPAAGAAEVLARGIGPRDAVVGIAASGRTPWVLGALRQAREVGAFTIAIANVKPAAVDPIAHITLAAITGPEPVTGSTRMKAGTAQKMLLNMLSTGVMVLLGKTYGNLMVDVKATNVKLKDRAQRIVMEAAGVDQDAALNALEQSEWHAKTAIVSLLLQIGPAEAREELRRANGFVRQALHR